MATYVAYLCVCARCVYVCVCVCVHWLDSMLRAVEWRSTLLSVVCVLHWSCKTSLPLPVDPTCTVVVIVPNELVISATWNVFLFLSNVHSEQRTMSVSVWQLARIHWPLGQTVYREMSLKWQRCAWLWYSESCDR